MGFWADRRGHFATLGALSLAGIVGAAGLAADYTNLVFVRAKLQNAADAAALAALAGEATPTPFDQSAISDIVLANVTPDIRALPPTIRITGAQDSTTNSMEVSVDATATVPTYLVKALGTSVSTVGVHATARRNQFTAEHCVYALDPTSNGAFTVNGAGTVDVPNCGIYVRSNHSNGLAQRGGGKITAKTMAVVGSYQGGGKYSPTPVTNYDVLPDPLKEIGEPTLPSRCDYEDKALSNTTLHAGRVYCGSIDLSGNIKLLPGIHYFRNAQVTLSGSANIVGEGVMLYFDKATSLSKSTGTGQLSIRAPDSGPYRGIALFGSRERSSSAVNIISLYGNKDFNIMGAVYLPRHRFEMTGSAELNVSSRSGWVIAWQFHYTGSSSMTLDTFSGPAPSQLASRDVLLVR